MKVLKYDSKFWMSYLKKSFLVKSELSRDVCRKIMEDKFLGRGWT